jgi:hypothetical protein
VTKLKDPKQVGITFYGTVNHKMGLHRGMKVYEIYLKNLQKALNLIDMPEIEGEKVEAPAPVVNVKASFQNVEVLAGLDLGLDNDELKEIREESIDEETQSEMSFSNSPSKLKEMEEEKEEKELTAEE